MGLLDKFFKKEEERIEIKFSELDDWLDREIARSSSEIVKETKPILREILSAKKKIKEIVLELRELQYSPDLPERFKNIIRTSKPKYVSSMLDVLDEITVDEKSQYQSILDFQNGFSESLEKIAKISLGHGRYLPIAFEKDLADIQKEAKNLIDANKKLKEKIESYSRIPLLNKTKSIKRELDELLEKKKTLKKKREVLKRELEESNNNMAQIKKEHTRIQKDRQLAELGKRLTEVKEKRSNIEDVIHGSVTPLKRPLRKYKRLAVADKRLMHGGEKSIDGYIENPVEHFFLDNHLEEILKDMENAISEGKLEIKNPEKVSRTIKHALEVLTPALVDEYNALSEKEKQIEDEIESSSVIREIKRAEGRMDELGHKIKTNSDESKAVERRSRELEDKTEDMRNQLKNQLSGFNATLLLER